MSTTTKKSKTGAKKLALPKVTEIIPVNPKHKLPHLETFTCTFEKTDVYFYGIEGAVLISFIKSAVSWKSRFNIDEYKNRFWVRQSEIESFIRFGENTTWNAALDKLKLDLLITTSFIQPDGEITLLFTLADRKLDMENEYDY